MILYSRPFCRRNPKGLATSYETIRQVRPPYVNLTGPSPEPLLLQSAQLGAHRRGIALDCLDRVGGGEVVGSIRRQIPDVFVRSHSVAILR